MTEPVLCYVEDHKAWFTTCPLVWQWGDDWDDAPYAFNAGTPYPWGEHRRDLKPYTLTEVYYDGQFDEPKDLQNGAACSVKRINAGAVPWLTGCRWSSAPDLRIMAGTPLSEFKRLVRAAGGRIFVEEKAGLTRDEVASCAQCGRSVLDGWGPCLPERGTSHDWQPPKKRA